MAKPLLLGSGSQNRFIRIESAATLVHPGVGEKHGVFETGLLGCPPEKKAAKRAGSNEQDTLSGPVCEQELRNRAHFLQFPEQSRRISLHFRLCGGARGIRTLSTFSSNAQVPGRARVARHSLSTTYIRRGGCVRRWRRFVTQSKATGGRLSRRREYEGVENVPHISGLQRLRACAVRNRTDQP
jgi:hypothetical protein